MCDPISRQSAVNALCDSCDHAKAVCAHYPCKQYLSIETLPSAQPEQENYAELKQEFLRMASYIDCLLECSDEQKETLIGFITRLAEHMPWTERD